MPCEHGNICNNHPRAEGIPNLGEWLGANSSYNCVYAGKWHIGEDGLYVGTTDGISGFLNLPCDTGAGMGDYGDPIIAHNASAFLSNYDESAPYFLVVSFHNPHDICYWRTSRAGDWLIPDSRGNVNLNPLPDLPPNFRVNFREPEAFRKHETELRKYGDGWISGGADHSEFQWRSYRYDYFRMVETLDAQVGEVLTALQGRRDAEDTVVIFASDHGEMAGEKGKVCKSYPYNGALTVPTIVSWPGRIPENVIDDTHIINNIDLFPTVCDYAGIPAVDKCRGSSLRPILESGTSPDWRKHTYAEFWKTGRIILSDRYKYARIYQSLEDARQGVRGGGCYDPVVLLFDTEDDLLEEVNLAEDPDFKDILRFHEEILSEYESTLDWNVDENLLDPLPGGNTTSDLK